MKSDKRISMAVIRRLPRYYRYLEDLLKSDITKISSKELSDRMGLTASQIRQDLNCFGGFGQQGYGYNVEFLYNEIGNILGVNRKYKGVLIGAGHLGHAIANHINFEKRGVRLEGIFDIREEVVGDMINGIRVQHIDELEEFCKRVRPQIAILTIPKGEASAMTTRLKAQGVKAFWNFASMDLHMEHRDVCIENVHLGDSLMTLCYRLYEDECSDNS